MKTQAELEKEKKKSRKTIRRIRVLLNKLRDNRR